jgi:hypothetical protein
MEWQFQHRKINGTHADWFFDRDLNQTIEIKRIESKGRSFNTKKQAEQYGLDLCKAWVDKQS